MRRQNRVHMLGVLAVAVFLVWSVFQTPFARADETECTGTISGLIEGNVRVPPGESCTLEGVTVNGNVVADGADGFTITDSNGTASTVNGNVKVTNSTGTIIIEEGTEITGNLSLKDNMALRITLADSTIRGNLEIVNCTGEISIVGNTVAGNLVVKDNVPAPAGGGNTVGGTCDGQNCEELLESDTCDTEGGTCTVFVSSVVFTGDLVTGAMMLSSQCSSVTNGLDAGDCICQALADDAGLQGRYKAWLSDDDTNAKDRLVNASVPYELTNHQIVANDFTDLTDGFLSRLISIDANRLPRPAQVWTGTLSDGTALSSYTCRGWTSQSPSDSGLRGANSHLDPAWTNDAIVPCIDTNTIYCLEQ